MNRSILTNYTEFVASVTSKESNELSALVARMQEVEGQQGVNVSLLLTSAIGLGSEGGEFQELVKKILFQGKPLDESTKVWMMKELGDIVWYWTNACRALGYNPNEIVAENVEKLKSRYPGGHFDVFNSENRKPGDL